MSGRQANSAEMGNWTPEQIGWKHRVESRMPHGMNKMRRWWVYCCGYTRDMLDLRTWRGWVAFGRYLLRCGYYPWFWVMVYRDTLGIRSEW